MDQYRPVSPQLSYLPVSPDLSAVTPTSPEISGALPSPRYSHHHSHSRDRFGNVYANNQFSGHQGSPTSAPLQPAYDSQLHPFDMAPQTRRMKAELDDDEYLPDADIKDIKQEQQPLANIPIANGAQQFAFNGQHMQMQSPLPQGPPDPTLGVVLKTSFPVARIKRIMQADDDIGKVAQVTPHVVSRALELFMIKIISASAAQAAQGGGGSGKGPKRILSQHVKRALQADQTFDFLVDIISKVPDAPSKAKKEPIGSDSEDGAGGGKPVRRRGKKRKDSGDD